MVVRMPSSSNLPEYIKDKGLIIKDHWDCYVDSDATVPMYVGYLDATEAITQALNQILKNNNESSTLISALEDFLKERQILVDYANRKIELEIDRVCSSLDLKI